MRCRSLLSLLLALFPVLCAAEAPETIGRVLRVKQDVMDGDKPLRGNDGIYDQMRVATRKRAGAAILFAPKEGPDGLVQLGPDTEFVFGREQLANTIKGKFDLQILYGKVAALFVKRTALETDAITITAGRGDNRVQFRLQGTAVYLDVGSDGSTYLAVLEGLVTVESRAGVITVPARQQTYIAAGQPPTPPEPFNAGPGGGPDLHSLGDAVILEPPLLVLDDPRLNLPK